VALFAGPVKTLAPIGFGLHDERGSLLTLMSPVKGLPPVVPRLSVLRTARTADDALPQFFELMTTRMPVRLQPDRARLALAHGSHRVYVVPERQGGVLLAAMTPGLAADGVTKVEVDGAAALFGRNAFLHEARGRKAKQIEALLVTTKHGRFRLPLDRREFRP